MKMLRIDDLPHYSYADYKLWEGKWEIIDGIAYAVAPAPTIRHQRISNKIAWLLNEKLANYILANGDNKTAQVFYLEQKKYSKMAEASTDTIHFEISNCEFDFEFGKIWE